MGVAVLNDTQEGDQIAIVHGERVTLAIVTRTTATQIVVDTTRYRRRDGALVSGDRRYAPTACAITDALAARAANEAARLQCRRYLVAMDKHHRPSSNWAEVLAHLQAAHKSMVTP